MNTDEDFGPSDQWFTAMYSTIGAGGIRLLHPMIIWVDPELDLILWCKIANSSIQRGKKKKKMQDWIKTTKRVLCSDTHPDFPVISGKA